MILQKRSGRITVALYKTDKLIIYRMNIIILFLQQARLDQMMEDGCGILFSLLFAYFFVPSFKMIVSMTQ